MVVPVICPALGFRFGGDAAAMTIDVETLLDRTGRVAAESLFVYADPDVETALIRWSDRVAAASGPMTTPRARAQSKTTSL